jgi:hypothetical protein
MSESEKLRDLYETEIKPKLQPLEKKRRKIKWLDKASKLLFVGIIICFLAANSNSVYIAFGIVGMGLATFIMYKSGGLKKEYRKVFKKTVVREIVKIINPDWHYDPDRSISVREYKKSKLYLQGIDRHSGDDHISGVIDKTEFECSEFLTEYYTKNDKGDKSYHTIFSGLFFHAEFNKNFKGLTTLTPDKLEKRYGKLGQRMQKEKKGNLQLVKLENQEFEKEFKVYSTDQVEARYILTPTVMEGLVKIGKIFPNRLSFSFSGTKVYCAIFSKKPLFEANYKVKGGVCFADLIEMYSFMKLNQMMVNQLNLNTRIWTKE